jgi:NADPH:quinone reductase-like Zn-dependent oxidoreductase
MKAVVLRAHGGLDQLGLEEIPDPRPGPGEVLVEVHAASLNHLDVWVRRGIPGVEYPLPLVPGSDGAGVVLELGAGVTGPPAGTRVALQPSVSCGTCIACLSGEDFLCRKFGILGENRNGTHAERICVPAANVMPIAPTLSFAEAAAFPLTFLTAWHMAVARAAIRPGDAVLVHAGASGVGSAAIQIAKLYAARVATTVGSPDKVEVARALGADEVILYRDTDVAAAARAWTGKRGVDVILDHVGTETWEGNLKALAAGGRLVVCGATTGYEAKTNLRVLFFKNISLLGSTMGSKGELLRILPLVERGLLRPRIDRVLPFERIAEAHRALEERAVAGKIVLTMRR